MIRYLIRTLQMALHALRRNVFRSALTTLGIVIGVAAVIAMTEIGQGTTRAVQNTLKSMGATNLMIQPGTASTGGVSMGTGSAVTLTFEDADAIRRDCPAVEAVAPIIRARTQVVAGNRNYVPQYIYGTTPEFLKVREWEALEEGETFNERDVLNQVCLLGQTVVRELFPNEAPLGKEIRINNVPFKVIGILTRKGASMTGLDQDDLVLAPWRTIKNRVSAATMMQVNQSQSLITDPALKPASATQLYPPTLTNLYPMLSPMQILDNPSPVRFNNIDYIMVKSISAEEIDDAGRQIRELLRERHRLGNDDKPDDFMIRDMAELSKSLGNTSMMMMRSLFFVALVSLVVGGVGIMNIMMVSVTERTREIGLRMAVGARARDILLQFLVEAILLCLLGGFLGILFGRGAALSLSYVLGWPIEMSLLAIFAAVGVSAAVGLGFGYYPAWKASRLDPIEALRYE